jgi:hypothetical protein
MKSLVQQLITYHGWSDEMKVSELIAKLQRFPNDAEVVLLSQKHDYWRHNAVDWDFSIDTWSMVKGTSTIPHDWMNTEHLECDEDEELVDVVVFS